MHCYLTDCYNDVWLLQLSTAVGAVHIARPVVDYESYLCPEADRYSEGLCVFFIRITVIFVVSSMDGWMDLFLSPLFVHFLRLERLMNDIVIMC